jgi:hypothetical protein
VQYALQILFLAAALSSAQADEIIYMTIGKDTRSFHQEIYGKTFATKDPFEDFWWRYHEMVNAIFTGNAGQAAQVNRPGIREIEGANNAYAVIYKSERYILVDPNIWGRVQTGHLGELLLYGHELGHHVCGHSIGIVPSNDWAKELEADRFAGAAARALIESHSSSYYSDDDFGTLMNAAQLHYGQLSYGPTHPPAHMRIAAVNQGWESGSPCLSRSALDTTPTADTSGTHGLASAGSLWDHNGSVMALIAKGRQRTFVYQVPRSGLREVGVESGTLLFEGSRVGDAYQGTARIFSRDCGTLSFVVNGVVSNSDHLVTLHGQAPQVNSNCDVVSYQSETLVFRHQRTLSR